MLELIARLCRRFLAWRNERQTPRFFTLAPYESLVIRNEAGQLRTVSGQDIELSADERPETISWRKRLSKNKAGHLISEELDIYEVDTRERALDFVGMVASSSDEVLLTLDIRLHLSISAPQQSIETTKSLFPAVESLTTATVSEVSGEFPADDITRIDHSFTQHLKEKLEPILLPLGICLHRVVLIEVTAPTYFEEHLKELGSFKLAQRLEAVGGSGPRIQGNKASGSQLLLQGLTHSDHRAQSAAHYLFAMRLLDQLPVFLQDGQGANLLDVLKEYFRTEAQSGRERSFIRLEPESADQDPATMDIPSSEQP